MKFKKGAFISFFVESAYKSLGQRMFLLWMRLQELQDNHYQWLKDIYNELDNWEDSLTCILVGQEELYVSCSVYSSEKTTNSRVVLWYMI
ncbi:hypothetical protein ACT7DB_00795 [Bacillus cereus]